MDNDAYKQKRQFKKLPFNSQKVFNSTFKDNEFKDNQQNNKNLVNEEKKRYVESKELEKFIKSKEGLSFLITKTKDKKFSLNSNILEQVDFLIDHYTTWTSSFPVRKNLKVSKYDFLKSVEDFCSKNENASLFENLTE